ncbi:DUF4064 domain-containing protein [Bacillus aerolatus]|nr:DUF4064 domain-containing protein [Bacillus aerolatus]
MKRTAELILTVIGIIINLLLIAGGVLIINLLKDPTLRQELEMELMNDPQIAGTGLDMTAIMNTINGVGWGFVAIVTLSTVLSLAAAFSVRGNRRPKLAGGLLIASALIVGIGTILIGWLPALLFLIAGILCFARKVKTITKTT